MAMFTEHRSQLLVICIGLVMAGCGGVATFDLLRPAAQRVLPPFLQPSIFLGPMLLATGGAIILKGLVGSNPAFASWASASRGSNGLRRATLAIGLFMFVVGGCPWIYTPYLTGGQPGKEAAGMLGTLIFICVGLPGLALVLVALRWEIEP